MPSADQVTGSSRNEQKPKDFSGVAIGIGIETRYRLMGNCDAERVTH